MKVFFVGMHNKPLKAALDSSTMTGKVIDAIINKLIFECVKTNLCDRDYLPTDPYEINNCCIEWQQKCKPAKTDVVVLLGRWVRDNFYVLPEFEIINATHPAGIFGPANKQAYIDLMALRIARIGLQTYTSKATNLS